MVLVQKTNYYYSDYTAYKFTNGISLLMLVDLYHFFGVFSLPSETPVILSFL